MTTPAYMYIYTRIYDSDSLGIHVHLGCMIVTTLDTRTSRIYDSDHIYPYIPYTVYVSGFMTYAVHSHLDFHSLSSSSTE